MKILVSPDVAVSVVELWARLSRTRVHVVPVEKMRPFELCLTSLTRVAVSSVSEYRSECMS